MPKLSHHPYNMYIWDKICPLLEVSLMLPWTVHATSHMTSLTLHATFPSHMTSPPHMLQYPPTSHDPTYLATLSPHMTPLESCMLPLPHLFCMLPFRLTWPCTPILHPLSLSSHDHGTSHSTSHPHDHTTSHSLLPYHMPLLTSHDHSRITCSPPTIPISFEHALITWPLYPTFSSSHLKWPHIPLHAAPPI